MGRHRKTIYVEVNISEFSKEGHGMGQAHYPEGKVSSVEVPFTVPGDKVNALLLRKNKGIYQSILKEIIEPSSRRIVPRCIHFGSCGGCRSQQITYEEQLQQKELFIQKCFAPYLNDRITVHPIIPCLPPWEYRNKMEFSFSSDLAQNRYLGLVLYAGKGRVFNMQECHLVHPWFVEGLKAVRSWWEESGLNAYHPRKNTGSLRTLIMREGCSTGDRLVMLTVSGNPDFALNHKQLTDFKTCLQKSIEGPDHKLSVFLRLQQINKGVPTNFYEMLIHGPDHIREVLHIQDQAEQPAHHFNFRVSPSAFFQPNTKQAEQLYSKALQLIQIPDNSLVYDLYCGTGTLGICVAKRAKEVIGIELSPESVVDARENIKLNGLSNIQILEGDVGTVLAQLKGKPDVVMVDPPRAGLDRKAVQYLLEIRAPKLLYISCNPATQAANIGDLIAGGYRLEAIQPVDQFPQTRHVENIAILTRS